MFALILVYCLCLVSGFSLERRLPLNSLVQRAVVIFTGAAAQLIFCLQILSWPRLLTAAGLFLANLAMTVLVLVTARFWRLHPARRAWGMLLGGAWRTLRHLKREPLALVTMCVAVAATAVHSALGALMILNADPYHFEMPLFWIQHRSILPFSVNDPRVCALSFAAEGLALPGYLYAHSPVAFAVLSAIGAFLSLGIVFSLSRRLGASPGAAACAAAILSGYTSFAVVFMTAQAAFFLAGMWAAASALFLIDSRTQGDPRRPEATRFAWSAACFAMACGVKNSTLLMAPVYLLAILILHRTSWLRPRLLAAATAAGMLGLIASGFIWNYASNRLWYGSWGGPTLLHEALSQERGPREVWTRVSRGTVLIAFDTICIPNSLQSRYVAFCRGVLKLVGARKELTEDTDFYGLPDRALAPRGGLGLLGIAFFLPGLGMAASRWVRSPKVAGHPDSLDRLAAGVLVLMAVGAFVLCHTVMRWQSIGLLRLTPAFLVIGAPLAALLLEPRWAKAAALGLLTASTGMFLLFDLGLMVRRWDSGHGGAVAKLISRIQKDHALSVDYQWEREPPRSLVLRESYSSREVYQQLYERLKTPGIFGFIGGLNSGCYYLFGKNFENRVLPLVDARTPDRIADPPPEVQYVVFADGDDLAGGWPEALHFRPYFRVTSGSQCLFAVYQREAGAMSR